MADVSREEMFRLADGDLPPEERQRLIQLISSSEKLKREMDEVLAFNQELRRFWDEHLSRKCPDEARLSAFLEGTLAGDQVAEVEGHLRECPLCRFKIESARQALAELEELELAEERLAPSLIDRLKGNLEKLDPERLLDGLEQALSPTRLGEELFAFLAKGARVLTYPFTSPLEASALLPAGAGGVKLAETGRGFHRKTIVEEGLPFEVELVQFGERFILNLNTREEAYKDALIKYSLLEEGQVRYRGVLLVSGGKSARQFSEEEIETLRPEQSPLTLKIDVLLKGEALSRLTSEKIVGLVERLQEILKSEDPEMAEAALEALRRLEGLIPETS